MKYRTENFKQTLEALESHLSKDDWQNFVTRLGTSQSLTENDQSVTFS